MALGRGQDRARRAHLAGNNPAATAAEAMCRALDEHEPAARQGPATSGRYRRLIKIFGQNAPVPGLFGIAAGKSPGRCVSGHGGMLLAGH